MRKIDDALARAFYNNTPIKMGNSEIQVRGGFTSLFLHGNKIAIKYYNSFGIEINFCGYTTNVTKARINAILSIYNLGSVHIENGELFFFGDNKKKISENGRINVTKV